MKIKRSAVLQTLMQSECCVGPTYLSVVQLYQTAYIRKLLMAFIINIHRNEPGNTSQSIYISKVGLSVDMIIFF